MKLTILRTYKVRGRTFAVCRCRCGREFGARRDHVRAGAVLSCGCVRKAKFHRELREIEKSMPTPPSESRDGRP